jgi:hypothetical protein
MERIFSHSFFALQHNDGKIRSRRILLAMAGALLTSTPGVAALLVLFTSLTFGQDTGQSNFDVLDFIDPFIGTENGGMLFSSSIEISKRGHWTEHV